MLRLETAVTPGTLQSSRKNVITRRQMVLSGWAIPVLANVPARAFGSKEFWNEKAPSEWTEAEVHQLLSKSPWTREASISDTTRQGSLRSAPGGGGDGGGAGRRNRGKNPDGASANPAALVTWKATIRWESALPVREALHRGAAGETPADYILNVFGEVPGVETDSVDASLKENTRLEHKGDQIKLTRVEPAPKTGLSGDGTLFYFSRLLALRPEDKEVTFTTRLGPLEVKCKFALKDMLYRGHLEL
jgi:hypothetical protein